MFNYFGNELVSIQALKSKIESEIKNVTRKNIQDYLKENLNYLKTINDQL